MLLCNPESVEVKFQTTPLQLISGFYFLFYYYYYLLIIIIIFFFAGIFTTVTAPKAENTTWIVSYLQALFETKYVFQ